MKTLSLEEINKLGMRIRKPDGSPAVERTREPEPDKSEELLTMLLEAIRAMRETKTNVVVEANPQLELLSSSILKVLKQNTELMQVVRDAMKKEELEVPESPPCEWSFEVIYDKGKITHIKAKEIK